MYQVRTIYVYDKMKWSDGRVGSYPTWRQNVHSDPSWSGWVCRFSANPWQRTSHGRKNDCPNLWKHICPPDDDGDGGNGKREKTQKRYFLVQLHAVFRWYAIAIGRASEHLHMLKNPPSNLLPIFHISSSKNLSLLCATSDFSRHLYVRVTWVKGFPAESSFFLTFTTLLKHIIILFYHVYTFLKLWNCERARSGKTHLSS